MDKWTNSSSCSWEQDDEFVKLFYRIMAYRFPEEREDENLSDSNEGVD